MLDRRNFLRGGAALVALAAAQPVRLAVSMPPVHSMAEQYASSPLWAASTAEQILTDLVYMIDRLVLNGSPDTVMLTGLQYMEFIKCSKSSTIQRIAKVNARLSVAHHSAA